MARSHAVVRTGQDVDADDLAASESPLDGVRGCAPVQPSITRLHAPQGQLRGIQHPVLTLGSHTETHTPRRTPQLETATKKEQEKLWRFFS